MFPNQLTRTLLLCTVTLLLACVAFSQASVLVTGQNASVAFSSTSWAGSLSNTDLINAGQSSFNSATVSTSHASFPVSGLNNGGTVDTGSGAAGGNTFFQSASNHFPATATFFLNVSSSTLGYDITSIQSLMGWGTASQIQANQTYSVAVRTVGSSVFNTIATVSYKPFPDVNATKYESRVLITENSTGVLASGVDAVRFTFTDPLLSVTPGSGTTEGTLVRELDVFGHPTGGEPPPNSSVITLTSPTSRQIVQRSATNTGAIGISGTYTGLPASIQARALVIAGANNSGTTTDWQTINTTPTGGSFTGTLTGVPAGGWYQIEVRDVVEGAPGIAAVVNKVGVGDIFVTAGQSNSANYGSGGYVAADDRVSARTTVSGSSWVHAADPIPIASGSGGCVWTRLGDQLAAALNIPIGFVAVGIGSTQVSQWLPGTANYNNNLKPAIQSLPVNGFRAFLWHQGESDSIANVDAATHASRLASMIGQSRTDAGWNIPWYVAEASFHPNTNLSQETPVAAGQRLAVHSDPLVFLGPSTDEFHLESASGGKLIDSVHFNAAGLLDHATQWKEILTGTTPVAPKNSAFEDNHTLAITNQSALTDGATYLLTPSTNNASPMVLDWRVLSASGTTAADGTNGIHNPTVGTFAGAVDTANGGVLPNMSGKHVALLDGGSAGNYFLHSTRALATSDTTYTLTVALGVRDIALSFGTARLEITAKGVVVASGSFTKTTLDALRGGNAAGTFTDVSISWMTGPAIAANQPLAIRVVKEGGAGTVLDFDNVRFTSVPTQTFNSWIRDPAFGLALADQGFALDPDGDGLSNGIEAWFGTHPGQFSAGLVGLSADGTTTTFRHPQNPSIPSNVRVFYEWSPDLAKWFRSGGGPAGGPTVNFSAVTTGSTSTVTATSSETLMRIFLRAGAEQD